MTVEWVARGCVRKKPRNLPRTMVSGSFLTINAVCVAATVQQMSSSGLSRGPIVQHTPYLAGERHAKLLGYIKLPGVVPAPTLLPRGWLGPRNKSEDDR